MTRLDVGSGASAGQERGASPRFLADGFAPGANSLNFVRLVFALMVVVSHTYPLGFALPDPHTSSTSLGGVAVGGFFLLSGYLIARSWDRTRSALRFLWHRFLRIVPAFWVCLVVTALVIAPAIAVTEGRSVVSYFTGTRAGPWTYIVDNAAIAIRQIGFRGLLTQAPFPNTINGSLWTLFWESVCYGMVLVLGMMGALRSRGVLLALTLATWLACIVAYLSPSAFPMAGSDYGPAVGVGLILPFLIGACLYRFSDRVPLRGDLAVLALSGSVLGWFVFRDTVEVVALPLTLTAMAYLYFWAGIRGRKIRIGARRDLSYGVYIYAFPLQQLLAAAGAAALGVWAFMSLSALAALALAFLSWTLVESRALRLKDAPFSLPRLARRRPATIRPTLAAEPVEHVGTAVD